ncbi:MAG: DUF4838 domain-containing protein [Proteobacteria bacterium]|nr:DUF4838 domain-containing protein [Pseudomonadota bacterium]
MKPVLTLLAALVFTMAQGAPLRLADAGKPVAVIVVGESLDANDLAVSALVSHVKQISGAVLPVMKEAAFSDARIEGGRILPPVAKTTAETFILLGDGPLARRAGFKLEGLGAGGIVIQTTGNALALLSKEDGSDSRGPASARPVFTLLQTLGCRSLWPGEGGKVVPKMTTLSVSDLNVRFTPSIGQRRIRFTSGDFRGSAQGREWLGLDAAELRTVSEAATRTESEGGWAAWNGLGGNIGIVGGAAGCGLEGGWAEHGAAHPEWFALQPDGTRDQSKAKERWRLCVSNPGLIEHVAKVIIKELGGKAHPAISLCPNDGGYSSFCLCEACQKLDAPNGPKINMLVFTKVGEAARTEVEHVSLTDRYVHYWNAVAERVTKVVPDQLFLVEAYSYYSDPPVRERLHPNLVVRYVPSQADGWKGWQAAGARRVYWRPNNLGGGYRTGALSPQARETADTMRYLAANGMLATDMDSVFHNWATQGLHYYTAARLNWDPSLNFDALLQDYCQTGFGAGAEPVKRYFLLAEQGVKPRKAGKRSTFPLIQPETLTAMRGELVAAAKATADDPASHQRVAFLRAGFEFTAVSAEAHRLAEAETRPAPAAVNAVMERRWLMMRAIAQQHPLAVNVLVVAANDAPLNAALGWKGPSALARNGRLQLPADDNWLNEDQSATRKK